MSVQCKYKTVKIHILSLLLVLLVTTLSVVQVGRPVTNACLDGYNGTIFCYGQTGSGKTFTTFGPPTKPRVEASSSGYIGLDAPLGVDRGLVPRVLEYLFERFSKAGQGSPEVSWRWMGWWSSCGAERQGMGLGEHLSNSGRP